MKTDLTLQWWVHHSQGTLLQGDGTRVAPTIKTDTREDLTGALFLALRGETKDGHHYLPDAVKKGAMGIIVDTLDDTTYQALQASAPELVIVKVDDTALAYSALARAWLDVQAPYVIALTGSVGKTTTRDMVAAALGGTRKVHKTRANLNNILGVPHSVFQLPEGSEIAVFELGMSSPGQIRRSSLATGPDLAIITNIGTSHIGNFVDGQRGILRAKAEIVEGLKDHAVLLLNGDDPMLLSLAWILKDRYQIRFVHVEGKEACSVDVRPEAFGLTPGVVSGTEASVIDTAAAATCAGHSLEQVARACFEAQGDGSGVIYTASAWDQSAPEVSFDLTRRTGHETIALGRVQAPAPGFHQVVNSLFALSAADDRGISIAQAAEALLSYRPTGNRQRILRLGSCTIINDSYNAAPESMAAAFALTERIARDQQGRALAAIGCMAEQGSQAHALHVQVGRAIARCQLDIVHLIGEDSLAIVEGIRSEATAPKVQIHETMEALTRAVLDELQEGDTLLVKGSRRYGMEAVAKAVEAHEGKATK